MKPVQGKERRYWALLSLGNEGDQFVEVPKAYPVTIEGLGDLEFFAYKMWLDCFSNMGRWYVVEAMSGLSVSFSTRTKAQAIQSAKEVLLQRSVEEVKRTIKSRVDAHGLSPRYQEGGSAHLPKPSDSTSQQSEEATEHCTPGLVG